MSNNTTSRALQDLTAAMDDLWNLFLETLLLLSSFIPTILITLITVGLTSLLLGLNPDDIYLDALHGTRCTLVRDWHRTRHSIGSDPHPGWSVVMFQIYFGEVLLGKFIARKSVDSQPRHITEALLSPVTTSVSNMDKPTLQPPQDSLITAVIDVWHAIIPVSIVASSCIPATSLVIGATLLAIRASDIKREPQLMSMLFSNIYMMAHVFAPVFGLDPDFNRSAHKG
ncbi:hypothetical protein AC578_10816 [Pseudocercospora eumusae]|uniref:Uncharacterized protein n=1 Tax=Pseudocercospora eumusae TaxID=321146 RepID=A0A139GVX4_9PEZI|nr:hypothetical protein AC578_10816 [Pseudocercospora eumusae]